MTDEKKNAEPDTKKRGGSQKPQISRRARKHGYQGYPATKTGGGVHFGRGMSGVEPLGGGEATLPRAEIFTEDSTRGVEEEPEEDEKEG
jgi:hypothetical protein